MEKREKLKEIVLVAASTLGICVEFFGCEITKEEKSLLKKELIQGFNVDPVFASFLVNSLEKGIDFDWLEMYTDKRALYQINLGIIQGIDMTFSKCSKYDSLQLEAIRVWAKRGLDMKDLCISDISHDRIRGLAELKSNQFQYIPYVSPYVAPSFLRGLNILNQKIKHMKNKDVFLEVENVFDTIRLIDEGINIEKLLEIGFADQSAYDKNCIIYKLGISCRNKAVDKIKWAFDNIHLFTLQEFKMFDQLIKLRDFRKTKLSCRNGTEFILKSFYVKDLKGDVDIYDQFFSKDANYFKKTRFINCLCEGYDICPILKESLSYLTQKSIVSLIYKMIEKKVDRERIQETLDIIIQSLSILEKPDLVYKSIADFVAPHTLDYYVIDFSILLDTSVPEEFKCEAMVAKKLGLDYDKINDLHLLRFQFPYLLNNDINKKFLDVINKDFVKYENLGALNEAADFLDIDKFENLSPASPNIAIMICFQWLKDKEGFYILSDVSFSEKTVLVAIDALMLGIDIYPYVKDKNNFYAVYNLRTLIEEKLNVKNYTSRAEMLYNSGGSCLSDMYPF